MHCSLIGIFTSSAVLLSHHQWSCNPLSTPTSHGYDPKRPVTSWLLLPHQRSRVMEAVKFHVTILSRMTPNGTIPFVLVTSAARDDKAKVVDIEAIMNNLIIVLYTLTIVLGTTGNSVVIWVAGFKLKPTVTNVWLVNLAVADLIFCLSRVLSLTKKLFFDYWPFGIFLCKFNSFFKYSNMFCSVFLLAVISMDRTLCIWHPVFTKRHRTICAARLVSAGVWAVAAILSAPYFTYRQVNLGKNNLSKCSLDVKESTNGDNSAKLALYLMRFLCGFLLPFLIILCCYILAGLGIRRTRLLGKSRPLRILASLVCAFFLCWAPYHCLLLVKMVNRESTVLKVGLTLATGFAYFNSCVNPLLYFCMGLDMRGSRFRQSLAGVYRRALADDRDGRSTQSNERTVDDSSGSASRLPMVNVANVSLK
uniref:G-protein coupled receptors family 1 profile domain-containing protein n=1 Tax=Hucho hucho TaxID=62062 RepID=A0A4W5PS04_9TELE